MENERARAGLLEKLAYFGGFHERIVAEKLAIGSMLLAVDVEAARSARKNWAGRNRLVNVARHILGSEADRFGFGRQ